MRPITRATAPLVAGLCLLAVTGGCVSHAETIHHEETGRYATTRPLRTTTEITKEYVAQIQAIQHIEVRSLERGYLQEIHVDEGQRVEEGTLMFRTLSVVYEAELKAAAAEAEVAAIELENTRSLHEGEVVSASALKLAEARRDKAEAELALARAHFDLAQIRAPFDGLVGRLEVRKGSLLEEGELLTTFADNDQMWVYFNVTEAEYLDYRRRMDHHDPFPVKLRLANGEIFAHEGRVEIIEADFDNETGTIAFRATFPNPDGLLRHGETGNVIVSTPIEGALLVPQKATFDVLDKKFVFVVDTEGVAHLREITVSEELPHLYVVGSGLTEEDQVLLEGLRKVRDGHAVAAAYQEPAEVYADLDLPAE